MYLELTKPASATIERKHNSYVRTLMQQANVDYNVTGNHLKLTFEVEPQVLRPTCESIEAYMEFIATFVAVDPQSITLHRVRKDYYTLSYD